MHLIVAGGMHLEGAKEQAMADIKHIAFPVDFSDRCYGAVPFVQGMASRYGAKVTLIHVVQPVYAGGMAGPVVLDPEEMLRDAKSRLYASMVNEFPEVKIESVTEIGDPATVITDFVKTNNVDLIMMPSHGYGPFRQLLLGSVTAKVLHDVECPVWTSAHSGEAPDRAHLAVRKILCAVDLNPQSVTTMRWAAVMAKDTGAALRLVHVVPVVEPWPDRQMDLEFEEALRITARKEIEELEHSAGINVPACVTAGTVPDAVRREALQHGTDLLVIGRGVLQETLGRLRTHAYGIIRYAPCPVLSV
jgi:nucleotide-binding universal stress UspA family protein